MTLSHDYLHKVKDLAAFSIPTAHRQKLNQHSTRYAFTDGSILLIHATSSRGVAYDAAGQRLATHYLRINRQGD